MPTLSLDMKNEQICKTTNISKLSVLLQIIGVSNFEPQLEFLIEQFDRVKVTKKSPWDNNDSTYYIAGQAHI